MKIKADEEKIPTRPELVDRSQSERITWLVKNYLVKVASDGSTWTILYQDPEDKRYWELYFPHNELQGGGPPALRVLSEIDAKAKYGI